jgi:citrate lyase subunit beta/citryl-CoA lyase
VIDAGVLRDRAPRSLLFVPADRVGELLQKAARAGPDAIIVDLEDAILPDRRDAARRAIGRALETTDTGVPLLVRVNAPSTPWFIDDVAAVAELAGVGVVLPKVDGPNDMERLVRTWQAMTPRDLVAVALVETARGVLAAEAIAATHPAVVGLAFGAEDLAAQVGLRRSRGGREILFARSRVVLATAAAGRWAVDTPCLEIARPDVVRREAELAAGLGFAGKLVVHPSQVEPVNAAFQPTGAEIERAQRVVAAAAEAEAGGRGVGVVDGRMIDRPLLAAARRILERGTRAAGPKGGA